MSFYLRKSFSLGPVRLNLSRSGLGASFGVKGARIGVGPRGTYVHAGRGGFYYRQTLAPPKTSNAQHLQTPQSIPPLTADLTEISSSAAQTFVDSSAGQLLQELNRVSRRRDLFPACLIVGALLLARVLMSPVEWWGCALVLVAVAIISVLARHCDVTDGTLVLNYTLIGAPNQRFHELQNTFNQLSACQRLWHVDASGHTDDWKRNAGVQTIIRRSNASATNGVPPKITCNFEIPILGGRRNTLYFFPDRLLVRDSSGIGAVPYRELESAAGETKFVENESVPRDAAQVGTTWQYVAKHGGPDRRFSNNRQLPIMLYGNLALVSRSGIKELFQCSIPQAAANFCAALGTMGLSSDSDRVEISFAAPEKQQARTHLLWLSVVVMALSLLVLLMPEGTRVPAPQTTVASQQAQERERLASGLADQLHKRNFANAIITAKDRQLNVLFVKQSAKTVRQYGLFPVDSGLLLAKTLRTTEYELCKVGFEAIQITVNEHPPGRLALSCNLAMKNGN